MNKRRLRYNGRPKAFLGLGETGAILAAAGINVAGTMAASAINANATRKAAQDQAKATLDNAQRQADAIKLQTEKSREYQQQAQEFTREQNAENRELQKDIQMQLQMLTGQQNVNDRLEASKMKVKAGGKTKKANMLQYLLRGGNMPFKVTDGGSVIPIGVTPEGFDLYELYGNDHEHYHKTRGGKYKSGVGIKFADGNVVEGEGNQNKSEGELMLVTPDNAYFLSKHSINGFNPVDAVEQGLHPLQAYAIQERNKAHLGLNDDGTKAKYGKRKFFMGGVPTIYDYNNMSTSQLDNVSGPVSVGVTYGTQNPSGKRILRTGGSVRRKAQNGLPVWDWNTGSWVSTNSTESLPGPYNPSTTTTTQTPPPSKTPRTGFRNWVNRNADLLGAGITALGNIGGAWITSSANRSAANSLANAYNQGANLMADAYRNMRTIDMSSLDRRDYRAAHMMPALQAPVSFAGNQIAEANRSLQRRLSNAGRYSASSAAAQDRMARGEVDFQDIKNKIYSADQQQMQAIRQQNMQSINDAAELNAKLDTQANQQFGQDYLKLLQYNNDIKNQRILGSAGALSEGSINAAGAISQARTANGEAWGNAIANTGLTFGNVLSSMAKRRADLENTMLGATMSSRINYIARNGSRSEKERQKAAIQKALETENLSPRDRANYEYYLSILS